MPIEIDPMIEQDPPKPPSHGAAQHTDITREIFLPACEGYIAAGTAGLLDIYSVVHGGADLEEPTVAFTMKVPVDFVSFTSIKAIWGCLVAAGNMHWQLQAYYAICGEAKDTHSDTPALGVTATGGANIVNCQEPANPLTLASLALGDILGIVFHREGDDVSDTLDDAMWLFGLLFTYVANQ